MKKLTNSIIVLLYIVSVLSCNKAKKVNNEESETNIQPSQIALAGVEMNHESQSGTLISESAYYTSKSGGDMISFFLRKSQSDRPHIAYKRVSNDNGNTSS